METSPIKIRLAAAGVAAVAVLVAWTAQNATVRHNFGGAWSALFQIGDVFELPPGPAGENVFRFTGTTGYDGQFYRLIAYDPLLEELDIARYVDSVQLRWRRILTPAFAHLTAGGDPANVDKAFIGVNLAWFFLGVYWTALFASKQGRGPQWGFIFALTPAALISLERQTIDIGLAALCAGFAFYANDRKAWPQLWLIAALAPLARETGLAIPVAWALASLFQRKLWTSLLAATAVIPMILWYAWVAGHTPAEAIAPDWAGLVPLRALAARSLEFGLEATSNKEALAGLLDWIAVVGVWVTLFLTLRTLLRGRFDALALGAALFAAIPLFVTYPALWAESYAFARVMTPAALWIAFIGFRDRRGHYLAPLALMSLRVVAQLSTHFFSVAGA